METRVIKLQEKTKNTWGKFHDQKSPLLLLKANHRVNNYTKQNQVKFQQTRVVRELADQVGSGMEDPPCIKIGYKPWIPKWVFYLCIKVGYSSVMY